MAAIPVLVPTTRFRAPVEAPFRLLHGGLVERHDAATYRRRRLAVAGFAIAVALLVGVTRWATMLALETSPPGTGAGGPVAADRPAIVVRPGDSLWSIAQRLGGPGDVREVVDRLAASHGTGPLVPGERLVASTAGRLR